MADLRPLHGLRYQSSHAGELGKVLAPPYDVISASAQRELYQSSPYNVVRLEYGTDETTDGTNRYQLAADTLAGWRREGVLATDTRASFYLYEQEFEHDGRRHRRRSIMGRLRLEPWESGVILPHEHTLNGPKQDRLRLLRACRANLSPVFSLYRPDEGEAIALCEAAAGPTPILDAVDISGQRHRLWQVSDSLTVQRLEGHFAERTLYVADGHHRYETALTYRNERRAAENAWSGDEPENFVLMALTAADDPGLLILPIHRLVQPRRMPPDLAGALSAGFTQTNVPAEGSYTEAADVLITALAAAINGAPFCAMLRSGAVPELVTIRNRAAVESLMPAGHSEGWRRLGVNLLQYGILEPLFGVDIELVSGGQSVTFTEDATEAVRAVQSGDVALAFLVNATRPDEIFAVADAGDRMPQKSTYFYPKLGTGLVIYAMDAHVASEAAAV